MMFNEVMKVIEQSIAKLSIQDQTCPKCSDPNILTTVLGNSPGKHKGSTRSMNISPIQMWL